VFSQYGGYGSPQTFVDGLGPAIWVGAVVVGVGSLLSLMIPRIRRPQEEPAEEREVALEAA
jgi:hypothetical protein